MCGPIDQAESVTIEGFHSRLLVFEHRLKQLNKDEEQQVYQANLAKKNVVSLDTGANSNSGDRYCSRIRYCSR